MRRDDYNDSEMMDNENNPDYWRMELERADNLIDYLADYFPEDWKGNDC
jgi:hypothetical protein